MTGSINFPSEFGTTGGLIGTLVAGSDTIKQRLDKLTEQVSDGYISDSFAGLGSGTSIALSLQPEINSQTAWQNSITATTSQLAVTQTTLTQISSVASSFYASANGLTNLNAAQVDSVAASARTALQQIAGLLDTSDAGNYVFAGQDSSNPPVPDPDNILSSGFFTQIQSAVAGLATNGGAATVAATAAVASSNAAGTSPFSAALSQPASVIAGLRTSVATGHGQQTTFGIVASANAYVASGSTSATGSYVRDLLRGLATLGSLSSSQVDDSGFSQVVADTASSLSGVVTTLNQDAGALGDQQAGLTAQGTALANTTTALQTQLSGVQDVDVAKTLTQLSATQTQLQASYQLISDSQSLSLVKYLTAG